MDPFALLAVLEDARTVRGGGIPLAWTEIAQEMDIHSSTFSRLKQGRLPGPKTLRVILDWLEMDGTEFNVAGSTSLPIGPRDEDWDGEGATNRVFEWAGGEGNLDKAKLKDAFFYIDPDEDPLTRQAYKLPYCDVNSGGLYISPRGMSAISGGHGIDRITGASESEKDAIKRKVCVIYRRIVDKYEDWPECPFNPDGSRPERKDRRNDSGDGEEFKDYPQEERDKMAKNGEAMPDGSFPIADCKDLKNAIQAIGRAKDPEAAKKHIKKRAAALDCPDVELPDDWNVEEADQAEPGDEAEKTAGIIGRGALSQSEDPRTQALVARVQELLREGAVAVSIKHDLHPETSAALAALEKTAQDAMEGGDEEAAMEAMKEAQRIYTEAEIRPRHVAIVDTAAFSNARLTLGEDGYTVEGPITFEGIYTGDVRTLMYGSLQWDEDLLPIPIIWDPENNDHDGVVVGYVDDIERVDGMTTAVRPEAIEDDDIQAVVAAAGSSALPAAYFDTKWAKQKTVLTVGEEDENGLRHIFGYAAPYGVCHRSDMGSCFQYPKDVDKSHRGFHTGQEVTLSDGSKIRVGALTMGGKHLDPNLARQGVSFQDVGRHRDDANTVFAMVRAWEGPHGLAISGVVLPGVDRPTLMRAKTLAPSVELWPAGSGRTLVGVHLVPTPAWPVAASAGGTDFDAYSLTNPEHIVVVNPEGGYCSECGDSHEHNHSSGFDTSDADRIAGLEASLTRIEKTLAVLAQDAMTNIPLPSEQ